MPKIIQSQISKNIDYRSQIALQEILEKVYRFISIRPRSRQEIEKYLKRKPSVSSKNPPLSDFFQKILQILQQGGLLDDEKFARWWVEQRSAFRPKGKIALKMELRQKGIESDLAEKIIDESVDEVSLAEKTLGKKIRFFIKLPPREFRKKVTALLAYRGFSSQIIRQILEKESKER